MVNPCTNCFQEKTRAYRISTPLQMAEDLAEALDYAYEVLRSPEHSPKSDF